VWWQCVDMTFEEATTVWEKVSKGETANITKLMLEIGIDIDPSTEYLPINKEMFFSIVDNIHREHSDIEPANLAESLDFYGEHGFA